MKPSSSGRGLRWVRGESAVSGLPWIALLALLIGTVSGCRDQAGDAVTESSEAGRRRAVTDSEPSAFDSAVTVADRLERRVSFVASPQRIVSLTPSMTEVLYGIGAGERIVGATKYCNYPPAAKDLPRVGGGTLESINQESIVALEPDLVLCKWDNHEPLLKNLERFGIPVLALGPESLAGLYRQTRMLGRVTGNTRQAKALVESMQQRVEAVTDRIPAGDGPKVFYQVWDDPLMTAGPQSFIGELLSLSGGRNLFEKTPVRYPKVSPEVVVDGDPDVILAPSTHAAPVTIRSILTRPGWSRVRAIREQRVHLIDGDKVSRCGPRLVDALEEIVSVLYPERFSSPSLDIESGDRDERQDRAL